MVLACAIMDEVTFILDSCIHGYHVYKDMWNATPGETLTCIKERGNRTERCVRSGSAKRWQYCWAYSYVGKFRVFVCFLYVEIV